MKILLLGDAHAGKTTLLSRFFGHTTHRPTLTTVGIDFMEKDVQIGDALVRMQVWDTAGQERLTIITPMMYRSVMGVIVVYDITDWHSFTRVDFWLSQLRVYGASNLQKLLVGNKSDLGSVDGESNLRKVSYECGANLARRESMPFFETSALCAGIAEIKDVFCTIGTSVLLAAELAEQKKPDSFCLDPRDYTENNRKKTCKCMSCSRTMRNPGLLVGQL